MQESERATGPDGQPSAVTAGEENRETPGQAIHRQRISRAEYHARQRRSRMVRLLLAVLPFVLFAIGLALVSIGFFRYLEQESAISLFLEAKGTSSVTLNGTLWNQPVPTEGTVPVPTPAVITAESANGRLVTPFFYIGQQIGTLRFPSLTLEVKAFQGDSEQEFRQGAGHYTGSFLPGQGGNILVAGHRTSYFRKFEYLKIGDSVVFDTNYGRFTYKVREFRIINGSDTSIALPTVQEQLTMYTCYPFTFIGNAPKRYVVFCDLTEKQVRT